MSEIYQLTPNEMFELAGVRPHGNEYKPANIGKKAVVRPSNRTWFNRLCMVNFKSPEELKLLTPETVHDEPIYKQTELLKESPEIIEKYKAIVGDQTEKVYSVMSQKYKAVQHGDILTAIANTSTDTGINVFGSVIDNNGIMNTHATFADPDYHINVLEEQDDNVMMGIRIYNSHTGQTGFGAEIFGIRMVCCNYNAYGDVLGKIHWKHYTETEQVTKSFNDLIKSYMSNVPVLQKKIETMKSEELTIDEATAALYGISLVQSNVDAIIMNLTALNPEIQNEDKISTYELYNAGTAFISHKTAGDNTVNSNIVSSKNLSKLMIHKIDETINKGRKKIEILKEKEIKSISLKNTQIVSD
jgi:Domain of unknown function (DUF932).